MGTNNETTSLSLVQNAAHRGAGGKLRKQSSRKPPATPYARPQQQSRWLSKLVDPAYRLITGGATRILPSFFSNYKSRQHSLPAPTDQQLEDHHEILDAEEEECAEDGAGVNHGESRSTDVAGPSSTADRSKNGFDFDGSKQDKRENAADNDRLSEIEQLLEGKSFSRDEIHRLIEIIHSRAVDLPEQEKKLLSTNAKGDAERPMVALENPRKSIEEKQEDLSKTPWGTSTTPLQSSMQDKVGAILDTNPFKLHFSWFPAKQLKVHLLGFCLNVKYFQVPAMGWFKFLKLSGCLAMMVMVGALNSADSTVLIHFDRAPPARSRFSTAVFQFSVKRPDGSDACKNNECSVHYQLDDQILRPCPTDVVVLKNLTVNGQHDFLLNVTTSSGERSSSSYSWFIDTLPPTATILSKQNYTNAEKITIDIKFSEACTGKGGFTCVNSSNCNVIIDGPAHVQESSLRITEPNIRYSLDINLSSGSIYGRVVIGMADKFCTDIAGNAFTRTNGSIIVIRFDSTPAISTALHSFVTAGMLATSLAAAILSISSANLGVLGTLNSGSTDFVASNPSMNLQGMVGHLQVFVLSDWFLANQPIEYSETTKGLRWLIPRQKLPWRNDSASVWPNHVYLAKESLTEQFRYLPIGSSHEGSYHQIGLNLTSSSCIRCELPFPTVTNQKFSWPDGRYNVSIKNAPYGQFLNSSEYFTYFLRGEPISASNVVKKLDNYTGWRDLEMNLFWLGVGGGSLLIVHFLTLLFLRWRMGTSVKGMLSVPRFELLFVILMLPCISQSSAFVIRGGTTEGIITGALLLAIPAALILSVLLFVIIAIFLGSFVQYKEITHVATSEKWHVKLWFFFMGRPATGKWFYREGLPSIFFPIFGILFENRKGPPLLVFAEDNDPNTITKWTESGRSGIGRMRAVSSDDSNEEVRIRTSVKLLGCARSSYIILDLLRRVSIGIISGAYTSNKLSQSLLALAITLIQFISLFTLKPYIQRGVHTVESVSLLCEVGIFALCIRLNGSNPTEAKTLGFLMLALLFLMFVAQIINEWYAMIKGILGLSQPQKNSFRLGLKFVAKGLVLPFLPRRHWSRVMPGSSRPLTGLAPVLPQSPETECGRRGPGGSNADPFSAMTATVVPVSSPGSPGLNVAQAARSTPTDLTLVQQRAREGKQAKGLKLEPKSDLKKLRELAIASFSGDSKGEGTSTSYAFRQQSVSAETSVENSQASTSKFKQ